MQVPLAHEPCDDPEMDDLRARSAFVCLSVMVAACNSGVGSKDDAADAASRDARQGPDGGLTDTAPTTGSYAGYFRLQGLVTQVNMIGIFRDGEVVQEPSTTTAGFCSRENAPAIITGMGLEGTMAVLREGEVIFETAPPDPGTTNVTLVAGDELTFRGVVPDTLPQFEVGPLIVPTAPTAYAFPESVTLGEPVTMSWTAPDDAHGDLFVELVQDRALTNKVSCRVPVAAESVTIAAGLLDHLVPTDEENPLVAMAISPFDSLRDRVHGRRIDVEVLIAGGAGGAPAQP